MPCDDGDTCTLGDTCSEGACLAGPKLNCDDGNPCTEDVCQGDEERFDHILVDEYQDTNRLQSEILMALKPDGQGLCVVSDDAQSIYSFRAATVDNILAFPKQVSPAANVVTLDQKYRSTQPILDAANQLMTKGQQGF